MITVDDIGKKKPYTLKEIVEIELPEFWGGANESIRIANELQNLSIKLLTLYKSSLPGDFDQLKTNESFQLIFLNYLKMRSFYGLAYKIWEIVDDRCRFLAQSKYSFDYNNVAVAKSELIDCFSLVERLSESLDSVGDDQNGFNTLEGIIDAYNAQLDFRVMKNWSYRDITSTIKNHGVLYEDLWETTVKDIVPQETNIAGLMESPEDNKTVRMY